MKISLKKYQKGFVLAVSMIFLVVMTVLAITAIRRTTMDEKVATNLRVQNVAFQAAEKALRFCESVLDLDTGNLNMCERKPNTALSPTQAAVLRYGTEDTPLYPARDPVPNDPKGNFPNLWANMANWTGNGAIATSLAAPDLVVNVASQPQCLIEQWKFAKLKPADPDLPRPWAYVITARGVGNVNTAVVWVQEVIRCGNF